MGEIKGKCQNRPSSGAQTETVIRVDDGDRAQEAECKVIKSEWHLTSSKSPKNREEPSYCIICNKAKKKKKIRGILLKY